MLIDVQAQTLGTQTVRARPNEGGVNVGIANRQGTPLGVPEEWAKRMAALAAEGRTLRACLNEREDERRVRPSSGHAFRRAEEKR